MWPRISYLICATPRTGSYLLCEALTRSGVAGNPAEYFWHGHEGYWTERWRTRGPRDYVLHAVAEGSTPNAVFGFKTMWEYMDELTERLQLVSGCEAEGHALLQSVFPGLRYIFITRRDKLRQAISNYRAMQTGMWMQKECGDVPVPPYDRTKVEERLDAIGRSDNAWGEFFAAASIEPYRVVYEDFVASYEPTARDILNWLGIDARAVVFGPRHLMRQADGVTEEWVQRYQAGA